MRQYSFDEWLKQHPEVMKKPQDCEECGNTGMIECDICTNGICDQCGADCSWCNDGQVPCTECSKQSLLDKAKREYDKIKQREERLLDDTLHKRVVRQQNIQGQP